MIFQDVK
jgi:hypothetical protein